MNHHLPPGQERLLASRQPHDHPLLWNHGPRRHNALKGWHPNHPYQAAFSSQGWHPNHPYQTGFNSQGIQRCFPRPFMDNLRPPQFRAPDEPSNLVGGLRLGPRDVAPPYWPPLSLAPPSMHPPPMGALPTAMAHDEEGDCFMLGEKLSKKPKRIRTRVDAGEPRNSYSAFSSLPNLCGVSVNAVRPGSAPDLFSASQSFCGLPFVNYFNPPVTLGSRGMLSELFGAHTKPVAPCPPEDTVMGVLDKVTSSSVHSADAVNSVIRGPEPDNVLLREILQGRKRDLLSMEEIEAARSLHNNNNSYKGAAEPVEASTEEAASARDDRDSVTAEDVRCESEVEETMSQNSPRTESPEPRKRLENIVSVIRSSPTPNAAVNGCKKRKLYLPQQHEARNSYDSQNEEGEAGAEPDNKSRRMEDDEVEQVEGRAQEGDEGGLQIDLSVRRRSSPEPQRPSSPKPPTSTSSNDSNDASSYLLDYAQRLIRNQEARMQREHDMKNSDLSEKLHLLRNLNLNSQVTDLEGLADVLKTEITASLAVIIDTIVNKYVHQRKLLNKQAEVAAEQLNRDIASQLMERSRSPRSHKMLDRTPPMPRLNGMPAPHGPLNLSPYPGVENNHLNHLNLPHLRPPMYKPPHHPLFHGGLPPMGGMIPIGQTSPYGGMEPEQDEALPLVVTPKKKRHKVTDSRLTPRTVGRLLEDFPRYGPLPNMGQTSPRNSPPPPPISHHHHHHPHPHHRPSSFPQPPPLLPVSLPTSVAIPNPSLHDTGLLYPGYYGAHRPSSPLDHGRREESPAGPPHPHPHPLLHPALLAASSPDSFTRFLQHSADHDRASDCSPADPHYDGVQPTISFYSSQHASMVEAMEARHDFSNAHSSTLTPMHLRKAKLMFFYVRYPSSSVLKTFFPDIKFNKNNTAQLVKWFSNFREFYYIQMEKYARQHLSEGVKTPEDISVNAEAEIIRALNLHYNRNNHLEQIPDHFRYVVEQTLKEFFKAIQEQKDTEQSWKKAIYKVIARLDEQVPEYFKSPTFLEQLE